MSWNTSGTQLSGSGSKSWNTTRGEESPTEMMERYIHSMDDFEQEIGLIEDNFIRLSTRDYFKKLMKERNIKPSEVVRLADLDRDFGRQILIGQRKTRRDNYIRLAIALGLSFPETQSLLKFMKSGSIYVVRERDAAIMFCIVKGYDLMHTQLTLDANGFPALGDSLDDGEAPAPGTGEADDTSTRMIEQIVAESDNYREAVEKINLNRSWSHIEAFFDQALAAHGVSKKQALENAGINPNTGFQILRGVRRAKNPDVYIRLAFGIGMNVEETQDMLRFLSAGPIYALKERDFAVLFCMSKGYTLDQTQEFLEKYGYTRL